MENFFVLNVIVMIILHAIVIKKVNGLSKLLSNKQMLNGYQIMQNYALGVKKLFRDLLAVILWLVFVVKIFVICVLILGNQIIKIILNAIFIKKNQMKLLIDKNKLCKK